MTLIKEIILIVQHIKPLYIMDNCLVNKQHLLVQVQLQGDRHFHYCGIVFVKLLIKIHM